MTPLSRKKIPSYFLSFSLPTSNSTYDSPEFHIPEEQQGVSLFYCFVQKAALIIINFIEVEYMTYSNCG